VKFTEFVATAPADAIILDLLMPGKDGVEILRELGAAHATGKILIASGYADERVLETAFRLGEERGLKMVGVIHKPIRASDLRRELLKLIPPGASITADEIEMAIRDGQMVLHYQPRQDLRTGRITGVEALVRWNHPVHGLLLPGAFIGIAEKHDVMDRLTDWVAGEAVRQSGAWRAKGITLDVGINISARNVSDLGLPDRIEKMCEKAKVPPSGITLELTETAMQEAVRLMDVLTRCRIKGFRLSIDDFGTGYSSLAQLQSLPFSELKIDRSFVASMTKSPASVVIVDTIIGMAKNLALACVAEGIEDRHLLDALKSRNCDYGQGYHISRPAPAHEIHGKLS
jgi:EAL domain-containing protein (putative c-di-GMP-specific phosphodiesterase class I)